MARHTLHSDLALPELFMQQENLFKESTLGDDSVHLKWLFCKWSFAEMGVNSSVDCFFLNRLHHRSAADFYLYRILDIW